ncbi:MAG: RsmD family RNA methyltransferase [Planctomycetota bacterium]|jgi:tRNA A58 N-methylase Trm61
MNPNEIREKFGDDYIADERTFIMGIDQRFTAHFAERFKDLNVLETCTGGGFTTISLARTAKHVFTVEIDQSIQKQAISNVEKADLLIRVSFIHGNILDQSLLANLPSVDAVFIDPDWAATGPDHVYRFIHSNTQPPADTVLSKIFEITENVAIVLPPLIEVQEFNNLPEHEREKLYLGASHELFCLYFGKLIKAFGETEFRIAL